MLLAEGGHLCLASETYLFFCFLGKWTFLHFVFTLHPALTEVWGLYCLSLILRLINTLLNLEIWLVKFKGNAYRVVSVSGQELPGDVEAHSYIAEMSG